MSLHEIRISLYEDKISLREHEISLHEGEISLREDEISNFYFKLLEKDAKKGKFTSDLIYFFA